jgi:hypothetical protein
MTAQPPRSDLQVLAARLRGRSTPLTPYDQGLLTALDWLLGSGPPPYPGQLGRPPGAYDPANPVHLVIVAEAANVAAARVGIPPADRRTAHAVADLLLSLARGRPLPTPADDA